MPLPPNLTKNNDYNFGFAPSGRFSPLNKEEEDLPALTRALYIKILSHLLWIALWLIAAHFYSFLFLLIIVHLFLIGNRLTALFLYGSPKVLLRPPLWEQVSRALEKGKDLSYLQSLGLDHHPGLLVNLARAQAKKGEREQAEETLAHAQRIIDTNRSSP